MSWGLSSPMFAASDVPARLTAPLPGIGALAGTSAGAAAAAIATSTSDGDWFAALATSGLTRADIVLLSVHHTLKHPKYTPVRKVWEGPGGYGLAGRILNLSLFVDDCLGYADESDVRSYLDPLRRSKFHSVDTLLALKSGPIPVKRALTIVQDAIVRFCDSEVDNLRKHGTQAAPGPPPPPQPQPLLLVPASIPECEPDFASASGNRQQEPPIQPPTQPPPTFPSISMPSVYTGSTVSAPTCNAMRPVRYDSADGPVAESSAPSPTAAVSLAPESATSDAAVVALVRSGNITFDAVVTLHRNTFSAVVGQLCCLVPDSARGSPELLLAYATMVATLVGNSAFAPTFKISQLLNGIMLGANPGAYDPSGDDVSLTSVSQITSALTKARRVWADAYVPGSAFVEVDELLTSLIANKPAVAIPAAERPGIAAYVSPSDIVVLDAAAKRLIADDVYTVPDLFYCMHHDQSVPPHRLTLPTSVLRHVCGLVAKASAAAKKPSNRIDHNSALYKWCTRMLELSAVADAPAEAPAAAAAETTATARSRAATNPNPTLLVGSTPSAPVDTVAPADEYANGARLSEPAQSWPSHQAPATQPVPSLVSMWGRVSQTVTAAPAVASQPPQQQPSPVFGTFDAPATAVTTTTTTTTVPPPPLCSADLVVADGPMPEAAMSLLPPPPTAPVTTTTSLPTSVTAVSAPVLLAVSAEPMSTWLPELPLVTAPVPTGVTSLSAPLATVLQASLADPQALSLPEVPIVRPAKRARDTADDTTPAVQGHGVELPPRKRARGNADDLLGLYREATVASNKYIAVQGALIRKLTGVVAGMDLSDEDE